MKIPDFTPEQRRGLLVIGIGAITLTIFFFLSSRTEAVPVLQEKSTSTGPISTGPISTGPISTGPIPTSANSITPGASSNQVIYIDVAGKVKTPGVYQLPEGSRVIDAITIAGGVKLGVSTSHINLARKLVDGEQVLIMKEKFISAPTSSGRKSIFAGKVSLNSASKAQFDSLPGIGPVIAQRIIDYRNKNGPFQTLESIQSVSGIGESIFRQISSRLTL
ncbi:MAG: ComEA family DNA-binding protein [Actinobacteria bacterium]|nr:ComEA family DNA-binding protein [Actinomycetota bacterium]